MTGGADTPNEPSQALLSDAVVAPQANRLAAVEQAWQNLTTAGPILTTRQRHEIIAVARSAWAGAGAPNSTIGLAGEAAYWVASDPGGITKETVGGFEARGLSRLAYLEVVGVVARLANVDFYSRGLGASLPLLPPIDALLPTGRVNGAATITDSWVPMLSPALAPFVLDALPAEGEALRDIHEAMYIPMESLGDGTYEDELTRPQIEYVAARTSYLNECFY
ncbi:MAG: hypothetical protein GXP35_10335 [Actinobacteria bacterium]|nr:hypothetical protein [Actinomycetota bacterium]